MCLISSIVNSLKLIIYPILWVQTSITIVPLELLDILEAPMPYIVGVLHEHWNFFADERCHDPQDFLEEKCLVAIQPNNTIKVYSRYSKAVGKKDDLFSPYLVKKNIKLTMSTLLNEYTNMTLKQTKIVSSSQYPS